MNSNAHTRAPPLMGFSLPRIPPPRFLAYVQVGDFCVSRGPLQSTVPLARNLRNTGFFKSQNPQKAVTLCKVFCPIVNGPDNNSSTPYLTCKSSHIVLEVDQLPQPQTQKGTAINDEKEIEEQF